MLQDVTAEFAMDNPHMYVSGRKNLDLNVFQVRPTDFSG